MRVEYNTFFPSGTLLPAFPFRTVYNPPFRPARLLWLSKAPWTGAVSVPPPCVWGACLPIHPQPKLLRCLTLGTGSGLKFSLPPYARCQVTTPLVFLGVSLPFTPWTTCLQRWGLILLPSVIALLADSLLLYHRLNSHVHPLYNCLYSCAAHVCMNSHTHSVFQQCQGVCLPRLYFPSYFCTSVNIFKNIILVTIVWSDWHTGRSDRTKRQDKEYRQTMDRAGALDRHTGVKMAL